MDDILRGINSLAKQLENDCCVLKYQLAKGCRCWEFALIDEDKEGDLITASDESLLDLIKKLGKDSRMDRRR